MPSGAARLSTLLLPAIYTGRGIEQQLRTLDHHKGLARLGDSEVTFTLGDTLDEAVAYLADAGPGRMLLETIPEGPARDAALADVRAALVDHHHPDGVQLHGGIWLINATRPLN